MRRIIVAGLGVLLCACASAPTETAAPAASQPAKSQQPPANSGWSYQGMHDYEPQSPGLGQSFRYTNAAGWADLYVYDLKRRWADGTSDPQFRAHFEKVLDEIRLTEQMGRYQEVQLDAARDERVAGQPFRLAQARFKSQGEAFDSWVLLTAHRGLLIKYRVSFHHPQPADARERVEALVRETFPSAGSRPAGSSSNT